MSGFEPAMGDSVLKNGRRVALALKNTNKFHSHPTLAPSPRQLHAYPPSLGEESSIHHEAEVGLGSLDDELPPSDVGDSDPSDLVTVPTGELLHHHY